ncbi:MAG TPA: FtsW/RodA/SpoVE family cell cycle protein, partial [Clostridia bacterium]|nr:FtsW/RodA/SpoVE family cell cycle protein [Clostridia bacterium]
MRSERDVRQKAKNIEWVTVLLILGFVGFGLITIGNVMAEPFTGQESGISDMLKKLSLEYVQRQASNFLIGLAALIIVAAIDYSLLRNIVNYVYIANIVLLVMLLIVRNNTRGVFGWFTIGARAFQPSELCKVTLIIMLSKLAADAVERDGALKSFKDIAIMMFYFGLPFALVIMQPDFGTAVVFIAILICILFVSKISWKYIVSAVAVGAALLPLSYYYIFTDEQKRRIDVFLDPTEDLLGSGMHVARSK